jgi:quercetin dioxygenase-like cupin family protein
VAAALGQFRRALSLALLTSQQQRNYSITPSVIARNDFPMRSLSVRLIHHARTIGGDDMDEIDFEAKLRADGYTEIETLDLEPRPAKGEHGHPFSIRGLVLAGTFIVTQDHQRTVYQPGQVFAVTQGHPHDESIGPDGARVLVGRKFAAT